MVKEHNSNVTLLIIGALGTMGKVAQNSLPQTIKELETHRVYIQSVNLVDPGYRNIERASESIMEHETMPIRKFSALSDAMLFLLSSDATSKVRIFIYDASPTPYHYGHLALITQFLPNDVCYLGEKPIFISQDQLSLLESETLPHIYCNFSETMSEVSLKLAEELAGQNIISTNIARISSTAKKKAHGIDRAGVTGGALFDKGIHALAFTINIFGIEKIADYEILHSYIDALCLNKKEATLKYLDGMNNWDKLKSSCDLHPFDWSVDGAISVALKWRVSDTMSHTREVNSRYYFGWLGAEETDGYMNFQKYMINLGFEEKEWRLNVDLSKKAGVELFDEHVRCSVIETEKCYYVCNFLSSTNPENDESIWKVDKVTKHREKIFSIASSARSVFNKVQEGKTSRVFTQSILDWYAVDQAPNIAKPIMTMAHNVLLDIRALAFKNTVF